MDTDPIGSDIPRDAAADPHDVGAGAITEPTSRADVADGDGYLDAPSVEASVDGASSEAEDARTFDRD